jgi:hypothetical protein
MATLTLRTRQGRELKQVVATLKGKLPQTLPPYSGSGPLPYPMYEVVTSDGMTDVIEHRRLEDIFYVTEDPTVRAKLGVEN